ncbi:alkaline phosphatase family protein [Vitiosangium sp. GDMCC 1.1324]|uniref:alkaline phosphatase family protein n=1 Tax=Vitiosangium sp. (strain GDMCC 1.1324) TaxID=2138576 RepID=UPI000D3C76D4|nr:alkaline phosphatase family protein [Vitiosangium sp. GDMCC 1.1324]PTL82703.1 phosphodiesterase [Vitiosangium sp. GDMCC 1.1324]
MNEVINPQLQAWAREYVRRVGAKVAPLSTSRRRKLLVVHLDGVPKSHLEDAVRTGRMPFFSKLMRSGAYSMDDAFWGSPASTPFFQAGFLYGLRHPNLPAYSWFDRELGRKVQMNMPSDTLAVEARLRSCPGGSLLSSGGHTYFSLFKADASNRMCMSTLGSYRLMAKNFKYEMAGILAARTQTPLSYLRSLGRDAWKAFTEVYGWARALRDWRHESGFLMSRVVLQRLGWSFVHSKSLLDMVRGVPIVYLVYGNYDEVAHRRGPHSAQALAELQRVDAYLAELYAVAQVVEPGYDLIFLTDHGHVDSHPIEQRGGQRLEDILLRGEPLPLSEDVARGLLDGRPHPVVGLAGAPEEPVVVESGNFSHVYLTREQKPLEAAQLVARHPEVIARAARHPDIAIVAVRRGDSAVAVINGGVYGPGEIDSAPLDAEFSRRAVADFLRELPYMSTAGDLVLFGQAVPRGGTVGFAWEFGSHGGLTRTETSSLICWPRELPVDLSALSHCTQLHERLSEVYRDGAKPLIIPETRWAEAT